MSRIALGVDISTDLVPCNKLLTAYWLLEFLELGYFCNKHILFGAPMGGSARGQGSAQEKPSDADLDSNWPSIEGQVHTKYFSVRGAFCRTRGVLGSVGANSYWPCWQWPGRFLDIIGRGPHKGFQDQPPLCVDVVLVFLY